MIETMSKTQLLRETVRLVNRARKALGDKPLRSLPVGSRHHSTLGPLARALRSEDHVVTVGEHSARFRSELDARKVAEAWGEKAVRYDGSYTVGLPELLADFVHRFDRGEFPHLHIVHVLRLVDQARVAVGMDPVWSGLPEGFTEFLKLLPGHVDALGRYLILPRDQAEKVAKAWNKRAAYHVDEYYRVRLPEPLGRHIRFLNKHRWF